MIAIKVYFELELYSNDRSNLEALNTVHELARHAILGSSPKRRRYRQLLHDPILIVFVANWLELMLGRGDAST